jgi:DnaK suppressor protein
VVAALAWVSYKGPLFPARESSRTLFVAAKKPAKKAVKAIKSPAVAKKTPVAKAPAKKAPAKKAAPAVAKKPADAKTASAKKTTSSATAANAAVVKKPAPAPAKKSAAGKPAPKPAPKPVAKTAPAKSAPAKAIDHSKAPPVKTAVTPAPAASPAKAAPAKNTVPASKTPSKTTKATKATKSVAPIKPIVPVKPAAARVTGKIAVAVAARTTESVPKAKARKVDYTIDEATGRPQLPAGYKPKADEEYMSPLQLEYFRQRLMSWRTDLVEESKQTIENLKDEVRDVGDEAERATRETENSLELRTRDRYRKLIGKIDSTLKRLDAGDYGYCVDTGEEIGLERLEARLTAERTLDAQERWEHLQKQQGD